MEQEILWQKVYDELAVQAPIIPFCEGGGVPRLSPGKPELRRGSHGPHRGADVHRPKQSRAPIDS
jgi:hypothetical protein